MFTRNESPLDRGVRAVAGTALVVASIAGLGLTTPAGVIAGAVGAVLLFTAATGFCPLYRLLGVDTCRST
jgi:uncharacterized membrane protein